MRKLLAILLVSFSVSAADLNAFLDAVAKVESSNNPKAINKKESAFGLYQIRPAYFKDSGVKAKHGDVFKPEVARKVVLAYFQKYEPTALKNLDFETLARASSSSIRRRVSRRALASSSAPPS